jgi:hypothetical protein
LQGVSEENEGNLNDIRREASRNIRRKIRECLRNKINETETQSKNKKIEDLYRGINEFKKGYQPRTKLVKRDRYDLLKDPNKTLNRIYYCQLLNVPGAGVVKLNAMHTAELLVTGTRATAVEGVIGKLKIYKLPGVHQIPVELVQARGEKLLSEISELIKLISNKVALPHQWKKSIFGFVDRKAVKTDCSNCSATTLLSASYNILPNVLL